MCEGGREVIVEAKRLAKVQSVKSSLTYGMENSGRESQVLKHWQSVESSVASLMVEVVWSLGDAE